MHVPFSMSDEPDLGDEFKQDVEDYQISHDNERARDDLLLKPRQPIYTEQEHNTLMGEAIRRIVIKSLEARDEAYWDGYNQAKKDMDELEDDLMYAKDALRDVLGWIECSQSLSALRAICKRGLKE